MTRVQTINRCLALLVFIICVTGCWDRVEMEDRALVMGSGLDLAEDGQVETTVQIALPTGLSSAMQGGGTKAEPVIVISDKGRSGLDILQHLQEMVSRRIFLGQRAVIIIGEEYARQGIDEFLDTLMRSPDSRYTSYVLTAKGKTAKEILNTPHQFLEEIPALGIRKKQNIGISMSVKLNEFLNDLASDGKSPVTGVIKVVTDKTNKEIFKLDEAAVYLDNKLVGFLPEEEMKTLLMLRGEAKGHNITTQIEPEEEGYNGTISVKVLKIKAKIDVDIKKELPEFRVKLMGKVVVLENDTKLDLGKKKLIEQVENKINEEVDLRFATMLDRLQKEYKADVYGFGNEVHIKHPNYWRKNKGNWNEIYPRVSITTDVSFTIIGTGRAQAPPHMKK